MPRIINATRPRRWSTSRLLNSSLRFRIDSEQESDPEEDKRSEDGDHVPLIEAEYRLLAPSRMNTMPRNANQEPVRASPQRRSYAEAVNREESRSRVVLGSSEAHQASNVSLYTAIDSIIAISERDIEEERDGRADLRPGAINPTPQRRWDTTRLPNGSLIPRLINTTLPRPWNTTQLPNGTLYTNPGSSRARPEILGIGPTSHSTGTSRSRRWTTSRLSNWARPGTRSDDSEPLSVNTTHSRRWADSGLPNDSLYTNLEATRARSDLQNDEENEDNGDWGAFREHQPYSGIQAWGNDLSVLEQPRMEADRHFEQIRDSFRLLEHAEHREIAQDWEATPVGEHRTTTEDVCEDGESETRSDSEPRDQNGIIWFRCGSGEAECLRQTGGLVGTTREEYSSMLQKINVLCCSICQWHLHERSPEVKVWYNGGDYSGQANHTDHLRRLLRVQRVDISEESLTTGEDGWETREDEEGVYDRGKRKDAERRDGWEDIGNVSYSLPILFRPKPSEEWTNEFMDRRERAGQTRNPGGLGTSERWQSCITDRT